MRTLPSIVFPKDPFRLVALGFALRSEDGVEVGTLGGDIGRLDFTNPDGTDQIVRRIQVCR